MYREEVLENFYMVKEARILDLASKKYDQARQAYRALKASGTATPEALRKAQLLRRKHHRVLRKARIHDGKMSHAETVQFKSGNPYRQYSLGSESYAGGKSTRVAQRNTMDTLTPKGRVKAERDFMNHAGTLHVGNKKVHLDGKGNFHIRGDGMNQSGAANRREFRSTIMPMLQRAQKDGANVHYSRRFGWGKKHRDVKNLTANM